MFRKGSILFVGLLYFSVFFTHFSNILVQKHHAQYEKIQYRDIELFSYVESLILQKVIQSFRKEKSNQHHYSSILGDVTVKFDDEIAWIFYDFSIKRYARLDYDLVFDSTMAYQYLSEFEFTFVDKVDD